MKNRGFAAILAGLIPNPVEVVQLPVSNLNPLIERTLSNQELDLLYAPNSQAILVKTGDSSLPSVPTSPGRSQPSNFPTPPSGSQPSRPAYVPPYRPAPKVVPGLGANPAGAGGGGVEFDDDQCLAPKEQQQGQESDRNEFESIISNSKKKKKKKQDQCSIDEQNKAGIDELPDSSKFIYKLETKTARKALKKVWKNPEAKKEVLAGLDRMDRGELLPRNQKDFKGFKTLKEVKFKDTRMLVEPGKNGGSDQIVAIFMRKDLEGIASTFKNKYK